MKKYFDKLVCDKKFRMLLLFSLICNCFAAKTVKGQFPNYPMLNYVNSVGQFPANFAVADTASITDTLLTTCWYNIGYPNTGGILLLKWETPFLDSVGADVLIAIWDSTSSLHANVRFQLTDSSYTASTTVNFNVGTIASIGGVISPTGYNSITNSITSYPTIPYAKLLDIANFYNGPLGIIGIEFSNYVHYEIDILAVATTRYSQTTPLASANLTAEDLQEANFFFPNPATHELHILNCDPSIPVQIFDQAGRLILEKEPIQNKIDIHFLEKGMYILKAGGQISNLIKN